MKKLNFFSKIYYSIVSKDFYKYALSESLGKAFAFIIAFTLLVSLPTTTVFTYDYINKIETILNFFTSDEFEGFTFKNGYLELNNEEPLSYTSEKEWIIIIDKNNEASINDMAGYEVGYLIRPDRIILSQIGFAPIPFEYNKWLTNIVISDSDITLALSSILNPFSIAFTFILYLITNLIMILIGSLFASLIALFYKKVLKLSISYKQIYIITLYSLVMPVFIITILSLIPQVSSIISLWLFFLLSSMYISRVFRNMKTPNMDIKL